jgi:hypothetical protein
MQKFMPEKRLTFNGKQQKRKRGRAVEKHRGIRYARV